MLNPDMRVRDPHGGLGLKSIGTLTMKCGCGIAEG